MYKAVLVPLATKPSFQENESNATINFFIKKNKLMPADVNVCIYALVPLFLNLWVSVRSICMPREEKPAAVFHGFQQDLEVARFFFFFFSPAYYRVTACCSG